jgi:hypothetical protein
LPTKLTFIYGVIGNAASATLLCAIAGRKQATLQTPAGAIHSAETAPLLPETKPLIVATSQVDQPEELGVSA